MSRKLFMHLYYSTHVQWQCMWSLRKCEYSGLDIMEGGAEAAMEKLLCTMKHTSLWIK